MLCDSFNLEQEIQPHVYATNVCEFLFILFTQIIKLFILFSQHKMEKNIFMLLRTHDAWA